MSKHKIFLTAILVITCSLKISAQTERLVIPGELKQQTIVTEPPTLRKGFLKAGLVYHHSFIDRIFDEDNKLVGLGSTACGQSSFFQIHASYGLTDKLELFTSVPYIKRSIFATIEYHWENDIELIKFSQKGNGLGDAELGFRYLLLTENERRPSVFLGVITSFPTGEKNPTNIKDELNFNLPIGSGEYVFSLEMNARKVLYPYSFSIYGYYRLHAGGEKIIEPYGESISFKDGNSLILIASGYMHLNDWIVIANDFMYGKRGDNEIEGQIEDDNSWSLSTKPYLYFQIKHLRLVQSVNIPLTGYRSAADPSYILIVQYIF
jgi:hypothetical protein